MRILVASDQWSPDEIGGSARVAADTARALAARGHAVTAIVPALPGRGPLAAERGVEVRRVVQRHRLPQTLVDPIATRHAARRLVSGFDVLVGHQSTTAWGLSAALPDVPLVLVYHASAVLESRFQASRVGWREGVKLRAYSPALTALERQAVRRSSGILVLSSFSKEIVHRRMQTLLEGMDLQVPPNPSFDAYYALIDFEFWARKNIGDEAVEYLKKNVHPLDLAFRLAEAHGIVLLNGGGFEAPNWSMRVSLANLPDEAYEDIGRGVRTIARGYRDMYEASKK